MLSSCNYLKYRSVGFGNCAASSVSKENSLKLEAKEGDEQLRLNQEFNKAFDYKRPGNLLSAIDEILSTPSISKSNNTSVACSVDINDDGHIQINRSKNGNKKHLFVKSSELDDEVFCELSKRAIGDGLRYRDPWPQKVWLEYNEGNEWPPNQRMLDSKIKVADKFTDGMGRETKFIDNFNPNDSLFGVNTKAIISNDPKSSSITLVVQQDNTAGKHNFAPWIVAPVKVQYSEDTNNPESLVVFHRHREDKKDDDSFPIKDFRWEIHSLDSARKSDDKIILTNPCANGPNEEPKYFGKGTNWAFSATRGDDEVVLLRSLGKHDDHFQAYAEQQEYVELEFTGPVVPKGQQSNVAMKIDFIPLKDLTDGDFSTFGEDGNIKNDVITVAKKLYQKGIVKE